MARRISQGDGIDRTGVGSGGMSDVRLPPSQLLFEESPVPMAIGDLAGIILRPNGAFARVLAYDPATLIGRNIDSLRVPDDVPASLDALGPGGIAELRLERRFERSDGRILTGICLLRRFVDADGADRVLVAFLDETERREVERRLRYDADRKSVV
jgi:PAS domain S-box-containing protein